MSCGYIKKQENTTREEAMYLSKVEQADYVIYKLKGKKYHDKKTCWEKDRKGKILEVIYFV